MKPLASISINSSNSSSTLVDDPECISYENSLELSPLSLDNSKNFYNSINSSPNSIGSCSPISGIEPLVWKKESPSISLKVRRVSNSLISTRKLSRLLLPLTLIFLTCVYIVHRLTLPAPEIEIEYVEADGEPNLDNISKRLMLETDLEWEEEVYLEMGKEKQAIREEEKFRDSAEAWMVINKKDKIMKKSKKGKQGKMLKGNQQIQKILEEDMGVHTNTEFATDALARQAAEDYSS